MNDRAYAKVQAQQKTLTGSSPGSHLLQRTYARGQHTIAGGECSSCRNRRPTLLRSQRAFGSSSSLATVQNNSSAQGNVSSLNSVVDNASHFGHDFSKIPVYSSHSPMLQTKLTVNQPGDHYEQEADQVAGQVMRTANLKFSLSDGKDDAKNSLMRKQSGESGTNIATGTPSLPPIVHEVLNSSGGQPLDPAARAFMEPRFGYDFSQVRVHTDGKAAESARAVNALAYTIGHNVVFGAGQCVSTTHDGRKLMAHELTHVIQQDDNAYAQRHNATIGPMQDAHEREAERVALLIGARRDAGRVDSPGTSPVLQRQPAPPTDDPQKKPGKKEAITQPPPQKIPAPEARKEDKVPAKPGAKAEKEGVEKAASVGVETETKREKGKTTTEVADKFSFEMTFPISDIKFGHFSFFKETGVEASAGGKLGKIPTNLDLETNIKVISLDFEKVKVPLGIAGFGISASALASGEYSPTESKGAAKFGVTGEAEAKFKRSEKSPFFVTVKGSVEKTYDKEGNSEFKWSPLKWTTGIAVGREF